MLHARGSGMLEEQNGWTCLSLLPAYNYGLHALFLSNSLSCSWRGRQQLLLALQLAVKGCSRLLMQRRGAS
jgi:hypothetical protein